MAPDPDPKPEPEPEPASDRFIKVDPDAWVFGHPDFRQGAKGTLHLIQRKSSHKTAATKTAAAGRDGALLAPFSNPSPNPNPNPNPSPNPNPNPNPNQVTELFVAATFNDTSTTTPPICVMNMTHPR